MDTKKLGFDTKMVHAGMPHDALRQRRDADLPDLDVRLRQRAERGRPVRREGRRVHLHAHRQPDDSRARAEHRRTRERLRRRGDRVRHGGRDASCYMALLSQGAHIVSTGSVYGPSRGAHRAAVQPVRRRVQLRRHLGPRGGAEGDPAEHEDGLPRVAVEPGDAGHRHPRGLGAGPRARRARRRRQHVRQPVPPEAARPGRRRGLPLGDQVHQRPRRRRRRDHRRQGPGASTRSSGR